MPKPATRKTTPTSKNPRVTKSPYRFRRCVRCGFPVPPHRRSDAIYCAERCRDAAEKARYCKRNPDYVARQRKLVRRLYDLRVYGTVLDSPLKRTKDKYARARALGYRSGLEVIIARQIEEAGVPVLYEAAKIHYVWPRQECTYKPDYVLPNGILVETKGRFLTEDRQKSKHIKAQYPDLDLRFVFANANARLTKVSKTTYAKWSDQYGFPWAHKSIPVEWFAEPPCPKRLKALTAATRGAFKGIQ